MNFIVWHLHIFFTAKLTVLGQKTCNVVGEKYSWFCKSRRNLALCSVCLSVRVNRLVTAAIVFLVIYWCENLYDDLHQILCFSCIYSCSLNSFCKLCPPTELKFWRVYWKYTRIYRYIRSAFCPRSQTNLMTQTLLPSVFYIFAGTDCLYFFCFMCFCYRTFFIIELLWREYSLNVIFWFGFYHIVPIYMY